MIISRFSSLSCSYISLISLFIISSPFLIHSGNRPVPRRHRKTGLPHGWCRPSPDCTINLTHFVG
nr:MAG TPA: hypothetical protein [Caudoviricetes sp.]